jgi:hypothetical protein
VGTRAYVHHPLQIVNVYVAHHVRLAEANVRRGKYPDVKQIVVDGHSDGVSTALISPEAVDSLGICDLEVANPERALQEAEDRGPRCVVVVQLSLSKEIMTPTEGH